MKNISISERLILYFVTAGVLIIIIIGSITYYITKQAVLNRTFDKLISLRLEKTNRLESFFHDRESDLLRIATDQQTQSIVRKASLSSQNPYTAKPSQHPEYYSNLWIYFPQKSIILIEGNTIRPGLSEDFLHNLIEELPKESYPVYVDLSPERMNLFMITKVADTDVLLLLEIPQAAINTIMVSQIHDNGLGQSGESYLVGDDFLMRSNSRFVTKAILFQSVNNESVKNALSGITGKAIVKDYRNISCLSSYSELRLKNLHWVILSEMDEHEAMIPVDSIRNAILLISLFIAAAIFLFAFLSSQKIILPLKRLQQASEQIGAGDFNVELKVASTDEIGTLTQTFNHMTSQLLRQKKELEEEKTKRFRSLIDGQEMERQRLSRDLHDGLGQSLLAVNLKLEQASNQNDTTKNQLIAETRSLLLNTINEIRQITADLLPPVLEAFGIEQAFQTLCKETSVNSETIVEFQCQDIPENIDKKIQVYVYRIGQEAINNIVKHAKASRAGITMYAYENNLYVNFVDNGKGFDIQNLTNKGNGLINIRQRVELLKGECKILSSAVAGTRINLKIPLNS